VLAAPPPTRQRDRQLARLTLFLAVAFGDKHFGLSLTRSEAYPHFCVHFNRRVAEPGLDADLVSLEEAVIFFADTLSAITGGVAIEFRRFAAKVLSFTPPAVATLVCWGRHTRQPLTIDFGAAVRVQRVDRGGSRHRVGPGGANDTRPTLELPWRSRGPVARLIAAEQWTARLFRAPSMIGLVRDAASPP
jgi:hypothetical protein